MYVYLRVNGRGCGETARLQEPRRTADGRWRAVAGVRRLARVLSGDSYLSDIWGTQWADERASDSAAAMPLELGYHLSAAKGVGAHRSFGDA
jgi:hypothetical protein